MGTGLRWRPAATAETGGLAGVPDSADNAPAGPQPFPHQAPRWTTPTAS